MNWSITHTIKQSTWLLKYILVNLNIASIWSRHTCLFWLCSGSQGWSTPLSTLCSIQCTGNLVCFISYGYNLTEVFLPRKVFRERFRRTCIRVKKSVLWEVENFSCREKCCLNDFFPSCLPVRQVRNMKSWSVDILETLLCFQIEQSKLAISEYNKLKV